MSHHMWSRFHRCWFALLFLPTAISCSSKRGTEAKPLHEFTDDPPRSEFIGHIQSVAFSADGRHALAAGDQGFHMWDLEHEKKVRFVKDIRKFVTTTDGKFLLVCAGDKAVRLLAMEDLKEVKSITARGVVTCIAISRDGRIAAIAGSIPKKDVSEPLKDGSDSLDWYLDLWDIENEGRSELKGHLGAVTGLLFTPDGRQLISASRDGTRRLWDTRSQKEIRRFGQASKGFSIDPPLALSPDDRHFLYGLTLLDLEDLEEWKPVRRYESDGSQSHIIAVTFSKDGTRILSARQDGYVRLWDATNGSELGKFYAHTNKATVGAVAFSPDGKKAITGGSGWANGTGRLPSSDSAVRIWRITN